jgi:hypothetical protein
MPQLQPEEPPEEQEHKRTQRLEHSSSDYEEEPENDREVIQEREEMKHGRSTLHASVPRGTRERDYRVAEVTGKDTRLSQDRGRAAKSLHSSTGTRTPVSASQQSTWWPPSPPRHPSPAAWIPTATTDPPSLPPLDHHSPHQSASLTRASECALLAAYLPPKLHAVLAEQEAWGGTHWVTEILLDEGMMR